MTKDVDQAESDLRDLIDTLEGFAEDTANNAADAFDNLDLLGYLNILNMGQAASEAFDVFGDPDIPPNHKGAVAAIVVLQELFGGFPLPVDLKSFYMNALDTLTPNQQLMDHLMQQYADQFPSDGGGNFLPPAPGDFVDPSDPGLNNPFEPPQDNPVDGVTPGTDKVIPPTLEIPATDAPSPLVLDIDGDGIELKAKDVGNAVYWDADLDDFAELTGWITGGDGLLAIDTNGDGIITDHSELFGDQTGSPNGFVALDAYDTNGDDAITNADTQFGDLLVWIDVDEDGHSDSSELYTLSDLGITSISTTYTNVNYTIAGNEIKQESTFVINGNTRTVVDAYFDIDNINSFYSADYTVDNRVYFLPEVRGFGTIPALSVGMSLDSNLLTKVKEIVEADTTTVLSASFNLADKLEAVMLQWAGVDTVNPTSRGAHIDARQLAFLEELYDVDWVNISGSSDPAGAGQADPLKDAYQRAFAYFTAQFLVQTEAAAVISENAAYNPFNATVEGAAVYDYVHLLTGTTTNFIGSDDGDLYIYHLNNGDFTIRDDGGIDRISFGSAISQSDVTLMRASSDLNDLAITVGSHKITINDHFSGTNEEVETLVFADSTEWDLVNNLTFTGTNGIDAVNGVDDSNTLIGLGGDDNLIGRLGDDTYIWNLGDGSDDIIDRGGIDKIEFGVGITEADIRLWNPTSSTNPSHLYLYIGSTYLDLEDQFNETNEEIETAILDDGTILDLLNNLTFTGTSGVDTVNGIGDDNTLIGLGGNDNLVGGLGDDTYVWNLGDGSDDIIDRGGIDKIEFGVGITEADIRFWNGGNSATNPSHLHLYIGSTYLDLEDQFDGSGEVIETAVLDDGTVLDLLNNLTFTGTSSNEIVYGAGDNNTLIGLGGDDSLIGGLGDDIYIWNLGDGSDDLIDKGGTDQLQLGAGITEADIRLWNPAQTASHLHFYVGSTLIDLEDQFDGSGEVIETAVLDDGTVLDLLNNLTFTGTSSNEIVYGVGDNNTLIGLGGNDNLVGGLGDDTYVWNLGDGSDDLIDKGGTDQLQLGAGITEADIRFWNPAQTASHLHFYVGSTLLDLNDQFDGTGEVIETAVLDDGTVLDLLNNLTFTGTSSNDVVYGWSGNETLRGEGGADYIQGYAGDDVLYGGDGQDDLYGGAGADTFVFESATAFSGIDTVHDFVALDNDAIDLSDVLTAYDPLTDLLTDFVEFTDSGSDTVVKVDTTGTGSFGAGTQIATIENVTGLTDEDQLVLDGTLIAA